MSASALELPGGIVVDIQKKGAGVKPVVESTVEVHYEGRLLDGTVFDSSYQRGTTIKFPLRGVVPCWTQGLQAMNEGSVAMLTCPAESAYGARGVPGVIPPNSVLKFKVELVKVL